MQMRAYSPLNGYGAISFTTAFKLMLLATSVGAGSEVRATEQTEQAPLLVSSLLPDGGWVTLPVLVAGQQKLFMVDTGSPTSALDQTFRQNLRLASSQSQSPQLNRPLFHAPQMVISGTARGKINFPHDLPIALLDLAPVRQASRKPIWGIIGMDVLEHYALGLDFDRQRVSISRSSQVEEARAAIEIPMKIYRKRPTVRLRTHDVTYWAMVDTGALLSIRIQQGFGQDVYAYLSSLGNIREQVLKQPLGDTWKIARLDQMALGPFVHRDLMAGGDDIGLVGLYYWRRYSCTFDFPREKIYLSKSRYFFDVADESDHLGIYISNNDSTAPFQKEVCCVAPGSLGESLGFEVGDYILAIDGQPVACESIQSIYWRLSFRPPEGNLLLVRRGNYQFHVIVGPNHPMRDDGTQVSAGRVAD